jgi:hypothetical protein
MAAIANITIKKADNTTDVVYTALTGAPGDGTPAKWRNEDITLPIGQRASLTAVTKPNGKADARQVQFRVRRPVVRTVNSVPVLIGTIPFEVNATLGDQYTQAEIDEAVAQALNFFAVGVTAVRDTFKTGYAPT